MVSILNLRRYKPQNEWDVKVDRSSVLGNPYHLKTEAGINDVCEKYAEYFYRQAANNPAFKMELDRLIALYKKYGKLNLFCWCAPKRCHAETIRKYIFESLSGMDWKV